MRANLRGHWVAESWGQCLEGPWGGVQELGERAEEGGATRQALELGFEG